MDTPPIPDVSKCASAFDAPRWGHPWEISKESWSVAGHVCGYGRGRVRGNEIKGMAYIHSLDELLLKVQAAVVAAAAAAAAAAAHFPFYPPKYPHLSWLNRGGQSWGGGGCGLRGFIYLYHPQSQAQRFDE